MIRALIKPVRNGITLLGLVAAVAVGASGCASNVKGSWSCVVDRGGSCGSIADIDRGELPSHGRRPQPAREIDEDSVVADAVPAVLEHHGARWPAGPTVGAPVHEVDQIVKVVVAPWIDRAGDYHGSSEIFAVVRKGHWYVAEPGSVRRVDLNPETTADTPPAALSPAAEITMVKPTLAPPTPPADEAGPSATSPRAPPSTAPQAAATATPGVTITRRTLADGRSVTVVASTPVPNPPPTCDGKGRRRHDAPTPTACAKAGS